MTISFLFDRPDTLNGCTLKFYKNKVIKIITIEQ
jgi:hypothetical protein